MNKWQQKFKWQWWLIVGVIVVYFLPYLRVGLPVTHDGENHVARFGQYYLALKQGQWPPRVGPTLENGFGYPVFNYNYPLANVISLPLTAIKLDLEISFKLIVVAAVVWGMIGCWYWWQYLLPDNKQLYLPLLAYLLAPYLYQAIWYRGSIGEVIVYGLLPVICWQIERVRAGKKGSWWWLVVTSAALLLAHNVMVLLTVPGLIVYAGWRLLWMRDSSCRQKKVGKSSKKSISCSKKQLIRDKSVANQKSPKMVWSQAVMAAGLVMGLTAWFWWPALAEKKLVVLDQAGISHQNLDHAVTMNQLLSFNYSNGFSYLGEVDGLSWGMGATLWLTFWLSIYLLVGREKNFYRPMLARIVVILIIFLLLAQLPGAVAIWQDWPGLHFIQFPWRLSLVVQFLAVMLLATVKNQRWWQQCFWGGLIAWQLVLAVNAWPTNWLHKERVDYLSYPQSTTTMHENAPVTWQFDISQKTTDVPEIATGSGEIKSMTRLDTTRKDFVLLCTDECLVIEPTANFAGFVTTANQEVVTYTDDATIGGRIAYWLPTGEYQIQTRLTQRTPARWWGNLISAVSGVVLLAWGGKLGWEWWRKNG